MQSADFGWELGAFLPEDFQRKWVSLLVPIYKVRGTKSGIEDVLFLLTGFKGKVINLFDDSMYLTEEFRSFTKYLGLTQYITGEPFDSSDWEVRVPGVNVDRDEVLKLIEFMRPVSSNVTVGWTRFYDDFTVDLGSLWSTEYGSYKITDDTLVATPDANGRAVRLVDTLGSENWTDSVVTTSVAVEDSGSSGIVFHAIDRDNYYCFKVDSDGDPQLCKVVDGVETTLATYQPDSTPRRVPPIPETPDPSASGFSSGFSDGFG